MEQVTLRDWLAAQFLQARSGECGLYDSSQQANEEHAIRLARRCYRIADIMLKVRDEIAP